MVDRIHSFGWLTWESEFTKRKSTLWVRDDEEFTCKWLIFKAEIDVCMFVCVWVGMVSISTHDNTCSSTPTYPHYQKALNVYRSVTTACWQFAICCPSFIKSVSWAELTLTFVCLESICLIYILLCSLLRSVSLLLIKYYLNLVLRLVESGLLFPMLASICIYIYIYRVFL